MSCGKRPYRDPLAAKMAMAKVQRADSSRRPKTEARAYRCPSCGRWRLTSRR